MHVADDVERPGLVAQVVEEPGSGHQCGADLCLRPQNVYTPEAFAFQSAHPAAQLITLPADHVRAERPVRPDRVPAYTNVLGQVKYDRYRQDVMLPCQVEQVLAALLLHVGRVDNGDASRGEPFPGDVVHDIEGVLACRLVVLVVGDQTTAEIARDHLGRGEVVAGERRLASTARAHEHDQAQFWHIDDASSSRRLRLLLAHRVLADPVLAPTDTRSSASASARLKTAIWVGEPTSGSSWPTGRNLTS